MLSICKNYNQFVLLLQMCKSEDLNHTACSCQKEIIINTEIPKSWNVFPTLTTVNHPRSGGKEAAGTSGIFIFSKFRSQIAFSPLNTTYILFSFLLFHFQMFRARTGRGRPDLLPVNFSPCSTLLHRQVFRLQDNLAPDNLAPRVKKTDNFAPDNLAPGQFGTKHLT